MLPRLVFQLLVLLLVLLLFCHKLPNVDAARPGKKASRSPTGGGGGSGEQVVITTSRVFADAASGNASSDDGDWLKCVRWIPQKDIKVVGFIDSGRFSNVFEAVLDKLEVGEGCEEEEGEDAVYWSGAPRRAVLKVLKHTFSGKVKREIRILQLLRGARGIVRLLGVSRNTACFPKTVSLVFEHQPNTQWLSHLHLPVSTTAAATTTTTTTAAAATGEDEQEGASTASPDPPPWTLDEIRLFAYKLLDALRQCHSRGVMHRDVKPRNVVCQRRAKQLRLIDFGLSEFYIPRTKYNPSVASRHYKCPELLLEYCFYDYGVDIWAAGCVLAGLVFNQEPFFYGADLLGQLSAVAAVVGSRALLDWARKYKLPPLTPAQLKAIGKRKAVPLEAFRAPHNAHLSGDDSCLDLLRRMLCVDHQERASVEECLAHPFFGPVRGQL